MELWQSILLGIVQGLTEFLPISSSGHLILVPWLLDFYYLQDHPDFNRTFDVALHFGTMIAVVVYFRHEVWQMITGAIGLVKDRAIKNESERIAALIIIGTIPAVIAGALGEGYLEDNFGEPWQIAILLALFAIVLYIADRVPAHRFFFQLTKKNALTVGIAQILALIPGVSRSGITISAGRFLGLDRDSAARFSFLLLIPITAGAVLVKGIGLIEKGAPSGSLGPMIAGMVASGLTGYLAIASLLRLVRHHSYDIFVFYRLAAAAIVILLILTGVKNPDF